jgi:outer membrane protein OmpA-like peptidoglycan-associated protein
MNPIRHPLVVALLLCTATASLSACKKGEDVAPVPAVESVPVPAEGSAPASSAPSAPEKPAGFDINSVPVSTVALGDFPYIQLPDGYTSQGYAETNKRFARFPFWVNGRSYWVEGRFQGRIVYAEKGGEFSQFELLRNFDALVQQMGGVKVGESSVPKEEIDRWGEEITQGFYAGLGNVYGDPVHVYVIRRPEGNLWLHLVVDSSSGAYVIGQEKVFAQTAQLLPASEMKKQLDAAGKVALQVNFATDKTEVLADSLPQIEQVAALLKQDPSLQLAVNGHTDDSGDAAHNQQLSEGRAKSVVALLTAKGIDAARLTAAGFGSTQPVADNGTQEGKARNRRVELVKQ